MMHLLSPCMSKIAVQRRKLVYWKNHLHAEIITMVLLTAVFQPPSMPLPSLHMGYYLQDIILMKKREGQSRLPRSRLTGVGRSSHRMLSLLLLPLAEVRWRGGHRAAVAQSEGVSRSSRLSLLSSERGV